VTEAQVEIALSEMDVDQQQVFQLFVGLGFSRTLQGLADVCKEHGYKGTSLSTLKRWSSDYSWQELAQVVGRNISKQIANEMLPVHAERTKKQLETLDLLEDRFMERVKLDPANELTDEERARVIDVNLNDFMALIKTRRLIMGDPTERRENVDTHIHKWADSDLDRAIDVIAEKQFGLPPSRNVTVIDSE
jgi:hypothetical protein